MFNDLKGKRILITGSTAGMGLATARIFAKYGAKIGINSRASSPKVDDVLAELKELGGDVAFFPANLMETSDCEKLVNEFTEHFGGMDVLINNAGGLGGRANLENIDDEFYERVMNLNVRSALMTTKFSIPHLRASAAESGQTSCVISTGSIAAREGGGVGAGVYAASKAWLHDIHRNWVKEFAKDNIRFNIVSPGTIDTAFHDGKSDELKSTIASNIPMGRFGSIEEVAPTFAFFASHACSGYITGQILDVNGGQIAP
ncbi:SDR family NAD(P)-dependent oxidoreductase [Vibrio cyclitrophicus]|uniref:3-ketoacyl-ACP synthase n=4 Tax=Vibrio TaxID=662 RepID=A0A7Z1S1B3_9VIBR|nr:MULTISPECIES: SDR family oxidoreductase [Vibrio]KNH13467.1 3-ketoacyl-ACP synthase [Vibrio lentus]MBY7662535.1 SDR family oxidoreductase [Vibrio atlanticus]KAA8598916.1 Short-chain dehydrogenase/reductase SDR [Vibrio cyclitrophicus]MCC4776302.1 SDR family oxidoreductase [Vibrio cyclitrophicus]MCC4844044.1 SDR family oxidoreductase [Vibrio cyclitrophicus]|tara:strand:- start:61 stop:837 length:777 start_codon:yes stop_codon:yes gene_type:complete